MVEDDSSLGFANFPPLSPTASNGINGGWKENHIAADSAKIDVSNETSF